MPADHDEPPPSWSRRRLLLALGFGAANVAVLHRIRVPSVAPSNPPSTAIRSAGDLAGPSRSTGLPVGTTLGAEGATLPVSADLLPPPTTEPPALLGADPEPGSDHVFDLVITGGRVMDPASGFDGLADVGIDGDRVTALRPGPLRGRDTLDATGRVVAPGFIDLLSYEPNPFGVWLKLADGVTTNLAMHGVSNYAAPFFRRYEGETPIHFGGAFHQHFMRGYDLEARIDRALTRSQLDRLVGLAGEELDAGFAGVSLSPEYSPGSTTEELERLAGLAAARGHVCFVHVRHSDPDPPGTGLEAIEEMLGIAERTGVALHIEHLTSTGGTHDMAGAIARIDAARDAGLDVTACLYPYDFWGTFLASARFAPGWQDRYDLSIDDLQVAGSADRLTEQELARAVEENRLVAALGTIPESAIEAALVQPWTLVASDAILTAGLNNHPRGAGTFARTIAHYVRERRVLDLMGGLAKLTILPARRVEGMIPAMATKGRLQRGADADVVVFDPETIADRATVAEPAQASVGIEQVVVAGRVALRDGRADRNVLAGRALRSGASS